jgi:hypothetical protein
MYVQGATSFLASATKRFARLKGTYLLAGQALEDRRESLAVPLPKEDPNFELTNFAFRIT